MRPAPNGARKERLPRPDARGARHQYPGSALIAPAGNPAAIYNAWEQGKFTVLNCTEHLDEVRATLQKPRVANLIKPYKAGRLVNQIEKLAEDIGQLPRLKRSPDPGDNYLLALAEAGKPGDKSGLLVLTRHKPARIITARDFAAFLVVDNP